MVKCWTAKEKYNYNGVLVQADCFDFIKTVPTDSIDLIFTDPPYAIDSHGRGMGAKKKYLRDLGGIKSSRDNKIFENGFFNEMLRVVKIPNIFIFCNKIQLQELLIIADAKKLHFEIIILAKSNPTPLTNNHWLPDKEYAIHIFKNLPLTSTEYGLKKTVFFTKNFQDTTIDHPTPKPLEMCKVLLKNLSTENSEVFDPFMGSGTTAIACKQLDRQWLGCEINKNYIELTRLRLATMQAPLF